MGANQGHLEAVRRPSALPFTQRDPGASPRPCRCSQSRPAARHKHLELSQCSRLCHNLFMTEKIHSITVAEAASKIPGPKGERYAEVFKHGTLSVELYTPQGQDWQTPHTK